MSRAPVLVSIYILLHVADFLLIWYLQIRSDHQNIYIAVPVSVPNPRIFLSISSLHLSLPDRASSASSEKKLSGILWLCAAAGWNFQLNSWYRSAFGFHRDIWNKWRAVAGYCTRKRWKPGISYSRFPLTHPMQLQPAPLIRFIH